MPDPRERELVQAVRAELAAVDPPRACCRAAERAGLGAAAEGRARSPVIARLAVRLADGPPLATVGPAGDPGPRESRPSVAPTGTRSEATGALAPTAGPGFEWETARSHCRAAWLRGRFLATGSLSLGARGAHLELVVPTAEGERLRQRLVEAGFELPVRERRGRAVLTSKRTETILAFLRYCGAGASVLEVESRLVMRQMHGHLNRVLNAENANLERTVASSTRQLAIIEQLEADGRLGELPPLDRAVAQARRNAPESSFTELADSLGLSRARVQRAFERLESVASGASDGSPPRDLR